MAAKLDSTMKAVSKTLSLGKKVDAYSGIGILTNLCRQATNKTLSVPDDDYNQQVRAGSRAGCHAVGLCLGLDGRYFQEVYGQKSPVCAFYGYYRGSEKDLLLVAGGRSH